MTQWTYPKQLKVLRACYALFFILFFGWPVLAVDNEIDWPQGPFYESNPNSHGFNERLIKGLALEHPTLAVLLPPRFHIQIASQDLTLQALLDEAYYQILSGSETAQKICQNIAGSSAEMLELRLGVSQTIAPRFLQICKENSGSANISNPSVNVLSKRKIFFVFSEGSAKVDSWSSVAENATYIFLEKKDLNKAYLQRALVHELAVYADSKLRTLNEVLKKNPVLLKNSDLAAAIYNPYLIYSFSILRAMELEQRILAELGHPTPSVPDLSCSEKAQLSLIYSPLKEVMLMNSGFDYIFQKWMVKNSSAADQISNIQKWTNIDHLLKVLTSTQAPAGNSFCEFLATPEVSKPFLAIISRGPRPRIGNGWGNSEPATSDARNRMQLSMNEGISKNVQNSSRLFNQSPTMRNNFVAQDAPDFIKEWDADQHHGLDRSEQLNLIKKSHGEMNGRR